MSRFFPKCFFNLCLALLMALLIGGPAASAPSKDSPFYNYPLHPNFPGHIEVVHLPNDSEPMFRSWASRKPVHYRRSAEQCYSAKPNGHPIKCGDVPFIYRLADQVVLGSGPVPDTRIPGLGGGGNTGVPKTPEDCPLLGALTIALGGNSNCEIPKPLGCPLGVQLAWALGGIGEGCGVSDQTDPELPPVPLPAAAWMLIFGLASLPGIRWIARRRNP